MVRVSRALINTSATGAPFNTPACCMHGAYIFVHAHQRLHTHAWLFVYSLCGGIYVCTYERRATRDASERAVRCNRMPGSSQCGVR